jgi:tetratricopeptide (TPR) repeat protein
VRPRIDQTDYARDVDRARGDVADLERAVAVEPKDAEGGIRLVYRRYHLATLAGDLDALAVLPAAVHDAAARFGPNADLLVLEANVHLTLHRADLVRSTLARSPGLLGSPQGRGLLAEAAVQRGEFRAARVEYDTLVAYNPAWDDLARLAHLEAITGTPDVADRRYAAAQQPLTVKESRIYAWLEVQRGMLDVAAQRYTDADRHYRRAAAAYSGYWLVEQRRAELAAAEARYEEAAERYQRVLADSPRPDTCQALGTVLGRAGRPAEARACHENALAGYLRSAQRGEAHYLHHLAEFYADVRRDLPEAVGWARRDLATRPGPLTHAALARVLHLQGSVGEAAAQMDEVLSSGARAPQLLASAAQIYSAVGRLDEATAMEKQAAALRERLGNRTTP